MSSTGCTCDDQGHPVDGSDGAGCGSTEAVALILDFVGMDPDDYRLLAGHLDTAARESLIVAGRLSHWVKVYPDGVRVIEIWQAFELFEAFFRTVVRVGLRQLGLPEPQIRHEDVPRFVVESSASQPNQGEF